MTLGGPTQWPFRLELFSYNTGDLVPTNQSMLAYHGWERTFGCQFGD